MKGYLPGAKARMRILALLWPGTTRSTLSDEESNSSAESSSLNSVIVLGLLAFTLIVDGENLWFLRWTTTGSSAQTGGMAAATVSTRPSNNRFISRSWDW